MESIKFELIKFSLILGFVFKELNLVFIYEDCLKSLLMYFIFLIMMFFLGKYFNILILSMIIYM